MQIYLSLLNLKVVVRSQSKDANSTKCQFHICNTLRITKTYAKKMIKHIMPQLYPHHDNPSNMGCSQKVKSKHQS